MVPPQTLEAVTGNGVDGWELAEKAHASTTRVSVPTFRNPVRSSQGPERWHGKATFTSLPSRGSTKGLGAGRTLLLLRRTKLTPFSSPGWKGRPSWPARQTARFSVKMPVKRSPCLTVSFCSLPSPFHFLLSPSLSVSASHFLSFSLHL